MATAAHKRLGSAVSTGAIATADILYTCPAGKEAAVSTVVICNTSGTVRTFRVAVHTAATFGASGYIVYGGTVAANDSVFLTLGITVDPVNKYLLCSADSVDVQYSAFGAEITP